MNDLLHSVHRFFPETVLTGALLLVVLLDSTGLRGRNALNWLVTVGALAAAFVLSVRLGAESISVTLASR